MLASSVYAEILADPGIAVADVEGGKLQGYIRNGIYTYHGVPYAEADLCFLDLSAYGEEYKYSGNLGILDIAAGS